jgi:hypothetical protein
VSLLTKTTAPTDATTIAASGGELWLFLVIVVKVVLDAACDDVDDVMRV